MEGARHDAPGRQIALTGDPALRTLFEELEAYPAPRADGVEPNDVAVPLRLRMGDGELSLLSTVTTFGTAVDITVEELSIESFFPADAQTAEALRTPLGTHRRDAVRQAALGP